MAFEFKYRKKRFRYSLKVMKSFEFTMNNNTSLMDQVHELRRLKVEVFEPLQVRLIITKRPLS